MTTDYTKLRQLALAATPGPWSQGRSATGADCIWLDGRHEPEYAMGEDASWIDCNTRENAAFIAASNPQAVLALLDEIEQINSARREAQARVAELTTELQKMRVHLHRNTAAAMNDPATRWYVIDKRGFATCCADWEDARDTAREADQAYPDNAPHLVGWMNIADMGGGAA